MIAPLPSNTGSSPLGPATPAMVIHLFFSPREPTKTMSV